MLTAVNTCTRYGKGVKKKKKEKKRKKDRRSLL